MRWLERVQVRRCAPNVSTALFGVIHLRGPHVRCRFEKLFQERGKLQKASIGFLLFIREKLPFGADPQKDEWISAQVTLAMETFAPEKDYELHPGVIEIVRWKGLEFTSSVYVILVSSFRTSSFVDGPG